MFFPNVSNVVVAGFVILSFANCAFASGNDLTIKDGFGEEVVIKNGLFGTKQHVVKDRLGDKFVQKKSVFGSKDTEVNVLGNSFKKKKGLFGSSEIEGTSILGDKVTTKKGWFGRRTTTVDVSGVSSVIRDLFAGRKTPPPIGVTPGLTNDLPPELEAQPGAYGSDNSGVGTNSPAGH